MGGYKITVRIKGKVERDRAEDLDGALAALEGRARELTRQARLPGAGGTLMRRLEPVQQVYGRLELAGPNGLRGGVDVRGDGSVEAFTGRVRRKLVRQEEGESAYDALRRAVG